MKQNLKGKEGITLIALVITIIILLILAGITITSISGESGVLKKADSGAEENRKQTATEKNKFENYKYPNRNLWEETKDAIFTRISRWIV